MAARAYWKGSLKLSLEAVAPSPGQKGAAPAREAG